MDYIYASIIAESLRKIVTELKVKNSPRPRPIGPMFARVESGGDSLFKGTGVEPFEVDIPLLRRMLEITRVEGIKTNHEFSIAMTPNSFMVSASSEFFSMCTTKDTDLAGNHLLAEKSVEEGTKLMSALRLAGMWNE